MNEFITIKANKKIKQGDNLVHKDVYFNIATIAWIKFSNLEDGVYSIEFGYNSYSDTFFFPLKAHGEFKKIRNIIKSKVYKSI